VKGTWLRFKTARLQPYGRWPVNSAIKMCIGLKVIYAMYHFPLLLLVATLESQFPVICLSVSTLWTLLEKPINGLIWYTVALFCVMLTF